MKIWILPTILLLLVGAFLATTGRTSAAPLAQVAPSEQPTVGLFGTVTAIETTTDSVTITLSGGEVVSVDSNTTYRVPDSDSAALDDIAVGARLAIVAVDDGGLTASEVVVIPARPAQQHREYTVLKRIGSTLIAKEGETGVEVVIDLEFELEEDLVGEEVTFIGTQVEAGRFKAKGKVALRKIVERLQGHVDQKRRSADQERDEGARGRKLRELEALTERLEGHITKQIDRFTQVIVEAHDEDKPALDEALVKIKERFRTALEAANKKAEDIDEALERRILRAVVTDGGVNLKDRLLTVRTRGDVDVTVNGDIEIVIGEESASLEDIEDGDQVLVHFDRESGEAERIKVLETAQAKGRIDHIDVENRTITIALADGGSLTLTAVDINRVRINGGLRALSSLLRGTIVRLRYNLRTLEPVEIDEEDEAEHTVTIERIDKDARVVVGRTDDGREVTLRLANDARVETDGHRSEVNGLRVGARIHAVVDRVTDRVLSLRQEAQGQRRREVSARGSVTGVRTDINALSLRRSDGTEVAAIVDENAEVVVDGEPASLEDIDGDATVEIVYDPETKVAVKIVAHRRHPVEKLVNLRRTPQEDGPSDEGPATGLTASGTIAKVDPETGQVVVVTERRRTVVFTVNEQSALSLNGEQIEDLNQITPRAQAKVLFNRTAEGNVVDELHAHKRVIEQDTIREQTDADRLEKLRDLRGSLAIQAKGRPLPGARLGLLVTVNRRPVEGAQVTVNGRDVGDTGEKGAIAFAVPTGVGALEIVATFKDQRVGLKLRVPNAEQLKELRDRAEEQRREAREKRQSDTPSNTGVTRTR